MRILMIKDYKVFLTKVTSDGDPVFTAYFLGSKVTNRDTLVLIDWSIRDLLRAETESANENLINFYSELR